MNQRLHLFQGYGIELEYMIVDNETLNVLPVADELLKLAAGSSTYVEDFVNGPVTWSNELILHVIEMKCTEPTADLVQLEKDFQHNITFANELLKEHFNARLMSTAAHPWMNPERESRLWPHHRSEIYEKYNSIFDCRGHGWSNLQSMHINLPFFDNQEFAKLHSAARLLLPIIPALSASSPILDGAHHGFHDHRLVYYETNQKKVPSIAGKVIPERVSSRKSYREVIQDRIAADIQRFDPEGILDPVWLNSRGIIARFDRGSIEIRIIDLQECPKADLAVASLIICCIRLMTRGRWIDHHHQFEWKVSPLYDLYKMAVKSSSDVVIDNPDYLRAFGLDLSEAPVMEVWRHLYEACLEAYPKELSHWSETIETMLSRGALACRVLEVVDEEYSSANLKMIYRELSDCLADNQLFIP